MSQSLCYQPHIRPAPATLIDHHGKLQLGLFDASIADLNVTAFRLHSVMDKSVSRLAQHFAYKQFQFVCISGPDWLLAVAIADVRYVCSGFAYLYQQGKPTREFARLAPPRVVETHCFDGYYHEIFNELGREAVFARLQAVAGSHPRQLGRGPVGGGERKVGGGEDQHGLERGGTLTILGACRTPGRIDQRVVMRSRQSTRTCRLLRTTSERSSITVSSSRRRPRTSK